MATCPACAKDYTPPAAFCPSCGAVLDKPDTGEGVARPALEPSGELRSHATVEFGDVGVYIVRRFLALVVDIAGVGLLVAIALLVLFERINTNVHPQTPDGFRTFAIITLAVLFIYYWLFEWIFGTTLGKLLFGLEVRRDHDGRVGFGRAFVRNLLRIVDLAIIGFVLAAITQRRKRLGDMLAGTIVPSHRLGALAPILAIIVLGGVGYLAYAYGNAMRHARDLYNASQAYGPSIFQGSSATPSPTVPSTTPTVEPSSTAPAATSAPTATPSRP